MIQAPPYALSSPVFRFRALVSHAGRAALGGDREIALACFAVARLASGMLPPFMLSPGDAAIRVANTKQWIASLALPPGQSAAIVAVADAVGLANKRSVQTALSGMVEATVRNLDQASIAEIHELMGELG